MQVWGSPLVKKRSRLDIYADILEYLKRTPDGCQVTRLSYGAGLPIDRIKPMLENLHRYQLINIHVEGEPLQANLNQRRFYGITRKGLEFLDAYKKIQDLITYLDREPRRPGALMDL
jgi:predicted transcriptional regulator